MMELVEVTKLYQQGRRSVQAVRGERNLAERRLDHEVVVVAHQAEGVRDQLESARGVGA